MIRQESVLLDFVGGQYQLPLGTSLFQGDARRRNGLQPNIVHQASRGNRPSISSEDRISSTLMNPLSPISCSSVCRTSCGARSTAERRNRLSRSGYGGLNGSGSGTSAGDVAPVRVADPMHPGTYSPFARSILLVTYPEAKS